MLMMPDMTKRKRPTARKPPVSFSAFFRLAADIGSLERMTVTR
jgi:hypothetical protein